MRSAIAELTPAIERATQPASIVSLAMAVPDRVVTNATVAEHAGVTEQWIVHRTGVHERRHVSDGERLQDLAAAAGRQALEQAGLPAGDVDLVLVATVGADELLPERRAAGGERTWAPTAPGRWTSAPPAPASCRPSRSPPPRSRAAAASTCW